MSFLRFAVTLVTLLVALARVGFAQELQLPEPVGMEGDPAARLVLDGNAAFLKGDLRTASLDYRSALRRKPDFAIATFNMGLVEMHQGRQDRGLADMDRGITLAARHGMNHESMSRLRALRHAFVVQRETT